MNGYELLSPLSSLIIKIIYQYINIYWYTNICYRTIYLHSANHSRTFSCNCSHLRLRKMTLHQKHPPIFLARTFYVGYHLQATMSHPFLDDQGIPHHFYTCVHLMNESLRVGKTSEKGWDQQKVPLRSYFGRSGQPWRNRSGIYKFLTRFRSYNWNL